MGRLLVELVRVTRVLWTIEGARRRRSLQTAAAVARSMSRARPERSPTERVRLKRAIGIVDARMLGGPNCVRRSLLEMALDRGAARERLFAGFRSGGGKDSGHAWLESHKTDERFDAIVTI